LAVLTAIHELQHFLHFHLKEKSPSQLIPSLRPPSRESGDFWEVNNLGGRLGILSLRATKNVVEHLYLTMIENGKEVESLVNDPDWFLFLQPSNDSVECKFPLPKPRAIHPIPEMYLKSKILHKCLEEAGEAEILLEFNDIYYKHNRPNDKLGRKFD
jgi:hypothetical protein